MGTLDYIRRGGLGRQKWCEKFLTAPSYSACSIYSESTWKSVKYRKKKLSTSKLACTYIAFSSIKASKKVKTVFPIFNDHLFQDGRFSANNNFRAAKCGWVVKFFENYILISEFQKLFFCILIDWVTDYIQNRVRRKRWHCRIHAKNEHLMIYLLPIHRPTMAGTRYNQVNKT